MSRAGSTLAQRFAPEVWQLMQDWTAPPVLAASEPPGEEGS